MALSNDLGELQDRGLGRHETARAQLAELGHVTAVLGEPGLPVPAMVVGIDRETGLREVLREGVVACRMLADAVRDLHDRDRIFVARRTPLVGEDLDALRIGVAEVGVGVLRGACAGRFIVSGVHGPIVARSGGWRQGGKKVLRPVVD